MSEIRTPSAAASTESTPTVGGIAVTDLSTLFGGCLWLAVAVTGGLSAIERALALAPLVLVPLGLRLVAVPAFDGVAHRCYVAAVVAQPIGAVCVVASLLVSVSGTAAGLAAVWLGVALLVAAVGLGRTVDRGGVVPISETAIDVGLAYTTVGAAALVFFHLGIYFWFDPLIILLTAVHFHYAGFVLPVMTGLTGRAIGLPGRGFRVLAGVVLLGPAIIAVGISFSPLIEFVAVGVFTATVTVFGGYVVLRVAPTRRRLQAGCLVGSALALPVSMVLAIGYAVFQFTGLDPFGLTISRMVTLHGSLNAFGFGLLGLLGWRLDGPKRPGMESPSSS